MVYPLKINIVTEDQSAIDAIKAKIKEKANAKLWHDDVQWVKATGINSNGKPFLVAQVMYLNKADMNITLNWLKNKAVAYKSLLLAPEGTAQGSYVEARTCVHRKLKLGTILPGEKDVVLYRWDK